MKIFFYTGSHYIVQADLELNAILLSLPIEYWNYRHTSDAQIKHNTNKYQYTVC